MKTSTIASIVGISCLSLGIFWGYSLGKTGLPGKSNKPKYQVFIIAEPIHCGAGGQRTTVSVYENDKLLLSRYKTVREIRETGLDSPLEGRIELFYHERDNDKVAGIGGEELR